MNQIVKSLTSLKGLSVGIVGGGPGGLTLARLLQMRGASVTVFEQEDSRSARPQGSSLDLKPESGRRALEAAGLAQQFMKYARFEGDRHLVMDHRGTVLVDLPEIHFLASAPEIDRPELKELFVSALDPGTIKWGHKLAALTEGQSDVSLQFENQDVLKFDLVVGSDGANSVVRPYITDIRKVYSGICWIEGEILNPGSQIVEIYKLVDHGNAFALGEQKGFLMQEKGDGTLTFYLTAMIPQSELSALMNTMKEEVSASNYFDEWFRTWHPKFRDAVRASTGKFIVRPINGTPIDQSWKSRKRVTLIGDAAHLMPPFAGEGANSAMLDALVLSEALESITRHGNTHPSEAIKIYEAEMLMRTAKSKRETLANELTFHHPEAAQKLTKEILGWMRPFASLLPIVIRSLNFVTYPFVQANRRSYARKSSRGRS